MNRSPVNVNGMAVALCVLLGCIALCPASATATVIAFDTFGAGNSYDIGGRFGVDGSAGFQAFQFTPIASGTLDDVSVALGRRTFATTQTQFDLYDGTASALGILLESFVIPNTVTPGLSPGAVVTFSSILHPLLTPGQIYWLSYSEPDAADGSSSLWFFNDQGLTGTRLTSALPAATNVMPAFRINVSVPVPSTILLMVLSIAALSWTAKRDR